MRWQEAEQAVQRAELLSSWDRQAYDQVGLEDSWHGLSVERGAAVIESACTS